MHETNVFAVAQDNKCQPEYDNLVKVDVIKRDLADFPEDADKTKNTWSYENGFVAAESEEEGAENWLPISKMVKNAEDVEESQPVLDTEYFTNKDEANCAHKCEIYAVGCEWPYSATDYLKIDEDDANRFTVSYRSNIVEGYNTTYCLKCFNSVDFVTQDDIVVVQTKQTPWAMILIIIAAVICLTCACGSYFVGKSQAQDTHVQEAEKRSTQMAQHNDNQKIANKEHQEEVVDIPVGVDYDNRQEAEEYQFDDVAVSKPGAGNDGSDSQPESVNEESFYQPQRKTSVVMANADGMETNRPMNQ